MKKIINSLAITLLIGLTIGMLTSCKDDGGGNPIVLEDDDSSSASTSAGSSSTTASSSSSTSSSASTSSSSTSTSTSSSSTSTSTSSSSTSTSTSSSSTSSGGGSIPSDWWAYFPMESMSCTIGGSGATLSPMISAGNFSFVAGKSGNCVQAAGSGIEEGLEVGQKVPANTFSIAMWIRQDTLEDVYYQLWVIMDGAATKTDEIVLNSYNDKLRFRMYNGDTQLESTFLPSGTGVWNHIVVTMDGSTSTANVICYVNGSQTDSQAWDIGTAWDNTAAYSWGSRIAYKADVSIDEMYIYQRILSPTEVSDIYSSYP